MLEFRGYSRIMSQEVRAANVKPGQLFSRQGLEALLEGWDSSRGEETSCLSVAPGAAAAALESIGPNGQAWLSQLRQLGRRVLESDTGLVCLRRGDAGLVVVPPFPIAETRLIPAWDLTPLREVLAAEHTVGVVLIRLGRFSVAVYRGEVLVSSKTDARYVKGRHHAGGAPRNCGSSASGKAKPESCTKRPVKPYRVNSASLIGWTSSCWGEIGSPLTDYSRNVHICSNGGTRFLTEG